MLSSALSLFFLFVCFVLYFFTHNRKRNHHPKVTEMCVVNLYPQFRLLDETTSITALLITELFPRGKLIIIIIIIIIIGMMMMMMMIIIKVFIEGFKQTLKLTSSIIK